VAHDLTMTSITEGRAPTSESAAPESIVSPAPSVARIVVPVDGSPYAERALPVAAGLAGDLGAELDLLEVVRRAERAEDAIHHLDDLGRRYTAARWYTVRDDDPASAIVAAVEADGSSVACLATHGRDRSAALLGSVAAAVLDRTTQPVVLVGPRARPPCASDAPVVAAVDGSPDDRSIVDVAAAWAAAVGRALVVATVAEPVPQGFRPDRPVRRMRGPDDPDAELAELVARARGRGCAADGVVVYDPISVRAGLVRHVDRTAALLVTGAHRRTRPLRALVGSHTARVVHDIEVPVLAVPLGAAG
jgi:nucleotide-binding universal stress UspA family protein